MESCAWEKTWKRLTDTCTPSCCCVHASLSPGINQRNTEALSNKLTLGYTWVVDQKRTRMSWLPLPKKAYRSGMLGASLLLPTSTPFPPRLWALGPWVSQVPSGALGVSIKSDDLGLPRTDYSLSARIPIALVPKCWRNRPLLDMKPFQCS